jgi:hypothetical protein
LIPLKAVPYIMGIWIQPGIFIDDS